MKKYVLLLCFKLIFISCSNDRVVNVICPIYFNKDTLTPGSNFTLYFNNINDSGKTLLIGNKIEADIYYECIKGNKSYHFELNQDNEYSGLYSYPFQIPHDARTLHVSLHSKLNKIDNIILIKPLFKKSKRFQYSYLENVRSESNIDTIDKYINLERINYPSCFDYYIYAFKIVKNSNRRFIDSVLNYVALYSISNDHKMTTYEKINIYAFLATGNAMTRNYIESIKNMNIIIDLADSIDGDKTKELLDFRNNIQKIPLFYFRKPWFEYNSKDENDVISKLIQVAVKYNNTDLLFYLTQMNNNNSKFQSENRKNLDALFDLTYNQVLNHSSSQDSIYLIGKLSIFHFLSNWYDYTGDEIKKEEILKKGLNLCLNHNFPKNSIDTNDVIDPSNGYNGYLSEIYLKLCQFYNDDSNEDKFNKYASDALTRLFPNSKQANNLMNICVLKFKKYLEKGQLDSAESSFAQALNYEFNNMTIERDLYDKLNKEKVKHNIDTLSFEHFVKKINDSYLSYINFHYDKLQTKKYNMNFNTIKDTALFVFNIMDDCPACNIGVIELLQTLRVNYPKSKYKVIIVSNLQEKYIQEVFGKDIIVLERNKEVLKVFSMPFDTYANFSVLKDKKLHNINNYITDPAYFKKFL